MDSLKAWAVTICFAALAAGLANIIAPKGNMEKVYKFAVSLFFLCCVLTPLFHLKGISLQMNIQTQTQSQLQSGTLQKTVDAQKLAQAESGVSELITQACKDNGVTPLNVSVKAAMGSDGAISISGAEITLKKADFSQKDVIAASVKEKLSLDITVKEGAT